MYVIILNYSYEPSNNVTVFILEQSVMRKT